MVKKVIALAVIFCLSFEQSGFAQVAPQFNVPAYLAGYLSSDRFRPIHLRSIAFDQATNDVNLFLDKGDATNVRSSQLEETTRKLFEYFQIGLTLPNSMFWVNLRPDDPSNIIDPYVERTDLGKVLLEADLQLKKDMASCTSPDTREGRAYWNKLYAKAESLFGQSDIEIPTITRPWIVPGEIVMAQSRESAYVYKAVLNVMLEQDYLKDAPGHNFDDARFKELNEYSSQLIREDILPKLTREVNSAKRYAALRQVYYSLILAQWYKSNQPAPVAGQIDGKNLDGLVSKQLWSKETYYKAYKKSFEQGEYNKEEAVNSRGGLTIRRYFSGGVAILQTSTNGKVAYDAMNVGKINIPQNTVSVAINAPTDEFHIISPGIVPAQLVAARDGGNRGNNNTDFHNELNKLRASKKSSPQAEDIKLMELLRDIHLPWDARRTIRSDEEAIGEMGTAINALSAGRTVQISDRGDWRALNRGDIILLYEKVGKKLWLKDWAIFVNVSGTKKNIRISYEAVNLQKNSFRMNIGETVDGLVGDAVEIRVIPVIEPAKIIMPKHSNRDGGLSQDEQKTVEANIAAIMANTGWKDVIEGAAQSSRVYSMPHIWGVSDDKGLISYVTDTHQDLITYVREHSLSSGFKFYVTNINQTIAISSLDTPYTTRTVPGKDTAVVHWLERDSEPGITDPEIVGVDPSVFRVLQRSFDTVARMPSRLSMDDKDGGDDTVYSPGFIRSMADQLRAYIADDKHYTGSISERVARFLRIYREVRTDRNDHRRVRTQQIHDAISANMRTFSDFVTNPGNDDDLRVHVSMLMLLVPNDHRVIDALLTVLTNENDSEEIIDRIAPLLAGVQLDYDQMSELAKAMTSMDGGVAGDEFARYRGGNLEALLRNKLLDYVDSLHAERRGHTKDEVLAKVLHDDFYMRDFLDQIHMTLTREYDIAEVSRRTPHVWTMKNVFGDNFVVYFDSSVLGEIRVIGARQESGSSAETRDGGTTDLSLIEKILRPMLVSQYIKQLQRGSNDADKAAFELGRLGDERAVEPLQEYIRRNLERDRQTYNKTAEAALQQLGVTEREIEGIYVDLLSHPLWFVKQQAGERLGQIGTSGSLAALRAAIVTLDPQRNTRELYVRRTFESAIGAISVRISDTSGETDTDGDRSVVNSARSGVTSEGLVGKDGGTATVKPLTLLEKLLKPILVAKYLKQLRTGFRQGQEAARELGRFGSRQAAPALRDYIRTNLELDDAIYNMVAESSLISLGETKYDIEYLYITFLNHTSWYVKQQAAERLAEIGSAIALYWLYDGMAKLDPENHATDVYVKRAFEAAIERISGRVRDSHILSAYDKARIAFSALKQVLPPLTDMPQSEPLRTVTADNPLVVTVGTEQITITVEDMEEIISKLPLVLKEYDVRGNDEYFTPKMLIVLGLALGTTRFESHHGIEGLKPGDMYLIAGDNGPTTPKMRTYLAAGLRASGVTVVDLGTCISGQLYSSVSRLGLQGGFYVTRSHVEVGINGFKPIVGKTTLYGDMILKMGVHIKHGLRVMDERHQGKVIQDEDIRGFVRDMYIEKLTDEFSGMISRITASGMKIAVDFGGGSATDYVDFVEKTFGNNLVAKFRATSDPTCTLGLPDPSRDDSKCLGHEHSAGTQSVLEWSKQNSDVVIFSFDLDTDRVGIVIGGKLYKGDALFYPVIEYALSKYGADHRDFYYDARMVPAIAELVANLGGVAKIHPKGHSKVKATVEQLMKKLAASKGYGSEAEFVAATGYKNYQMEYSLHAFATTDTAACIDDAMRFMFAWLEAFDAIKEKHGQKQWLLEDYINDLKARNMINEWSSLSEQRTSMQEQYKKSLMNDLRDQVQASFKDDPDFENVVWTAFEGAKKPFTLIDIEGVYYFMTPLGIFYWGWSNTSEKIAFGAHALSSDKLRLLVEPMLAVYLHLRNGKSDLTSKSAQIEAQETKGLRDLLGHDDMSGLEAQVLNKYPSIEAAMRSVRSLSDRTDASVKDGGSIAKDIQPAAPKVLVVDANESLRAQTVGVYRALGFGVTEVTSAAEAFHMVEMYPFDMISVNGDLGDLWLAERLNERSSNIARLFVSDFQHVDARDRQRMDAARDSGLVHKWISVDNLKRDIEAAVDEFTSVRSGKDGGLRSIIRNKEETIKKYEAQRDEINEQLQTATGLDRIILFDRLEQALDMILYTQDQLRKLLKPESWRNGSIEKNKEYKIKSRLLSEKYRTQDLVFVVNGPHQIFLKDKWYGAVRGSDYGYETADDYVTREQIELSSRFSGDDPNDTAVFYGEIMDEQGNILGIELAHAKELTPMQAAVSDTAVANDGGTIHGAMVHDLATKLLGQLEERINKTDAVGSSETVAKLIILAGPAMKAQLEKLSSNWSWDSDGSSFSRERALIALQQINDNEDDWSWKGSVRIEDLDIERVHSADVEPIGNDITGKADAEKYGGPMSGAVVNDLVTALLGQLEERIKKTDAVGSSETVAKLIVLAGPAMKAQLEKLSSNWSWDSDGSAFSRERALIALQQINDNKDYRSWKTWVDIEGLDEVNTLVDGNGMHFWRNNRDGQKIVSDLLNTRKWNLRDGGNIADIDAQHTAVDGQVSSQDEQTMPVGGIDLRSVPLSKHSDAAMLTAVVAGSDAEIKTTQQLDSEWAGIEKSIMSGPMPYEQLKQYAISCCTNKDAVEQREKLTASIANLLKLEEEAAVPTAAELTEILVVLS